MLLRIDATGLSWLCCEICRVSPILGIPKPLDRARPGRAPAHPTRPSKLTPPSPPHLGERRIIAVHAITTTKSAWLSDETHLVGHENGPKQQVFRLSQPQSQKYLTALQSIIRLFGCRRRLEGCTGTDQAKVGLHGTYRNIGVCRTFNHHQPDNSVAKSNTSNRAHLTARELSQ